MKVGPFSYYPIRVELPDRPTYMSNEDGKGGRTLVRSAFALVTGSVEIGGVPVLVAYRWDDDKGWAYPNHGLQGMDCNGDGRIDQASNSEEMVYAENDSPIFHVNGHYLSTVSLDLKGGTFVVREHPAEDYLRIPLRVGNAVPDFAFTDLDGKAHKFAEFAASICCWISGERGAPLAARSCRIWKRLIDSSGRATLSSWGWAMTRICRKPGKCSPKRASPIRSRAAKRATTWCTIDSASAPFPQKRW